MRLLPQTQIENYCTYLTDYLFEELDEIVFVNINSFIADDKDYRLELINSEINFEVIPDFMAKDFSPLAQSLIKHRAFTVFDKEMDKILAEYEEKGEVIFSDIGTLEKWFAKAFMNQIDSFEMGFPDLIKGKLKFYHFQEKHRRERLKEKNELAYLLLNKTIREFVIRQFRQFNEYESEIRFNVSKWKSKLFDKMVARVDRAYQRYIPNKFLSRKEVVANILKRIDVLDKKMKNLEFKLEKKKAKKGSVLHNETIIGLLENKIEIDFYNKFLIESLAAVAEEENLENPKPKQIIGTTNQQNLMVFYLLEYGKIRDYNVTHSVYADLIQFLTGKSHGSIRKKWATTIFRSSDKERIKDLEVVRAFFVAIRATEIVKMIDNDINLKSKYS